MQLNDSKPGAYYPHEVSSSWLQAHSTFLHENIHWWQHVGSNFGLISSLKFPAQAHISSNDLLSLLDADGAFKSILKYAESDSYNGDNPFVNNILNTWYDIEIAGMASFAPRLLKPYLNSSFFRSAEHSYHILWASSIASIAAIVDKSFSFLPDVRKWDVPFQRLMEDEGHQNLSDYSLLYSPLGAQAIYEGQARFSQLQYLSIAMQEGLSVMDFKSIGMLEGIYVQAFECFLQLLGKDWPLSVIDPLVGLFLLVCDVAINPTNGFPMPILYYPSFLLINDPGLRFCTLCKLIRNEVPELMSAIVNYSKQEYVEVSRRLAGFLRCVSPHESAAFIVGWIEKDPSIHQLLKEEGVFKFDENALLLRLFFSKYLRFQEDKYQYPQFFCWPGIGMTTHPANELAFDQAIRLFDKHRALFMDDIDGTIYPVLFDGYSEPHLSDTLSGFYAWNCTYGLIRQWICQQGAFDFDYRWLTTKIGQREMEDWVCSLFQQLFPRHPKDFKIL